MPALDMDDFMTEHTGQFIRGLGALDQSRENVNGPAGNGKSVELIVLYDEESIVEGLWSGGR